MQRREIRWRAFKDHQQSWEGQGSDAVRRWINGLSAIILLAMIALGVANLIRIERSTGEDVSTVVASAIDVEQPAGPLTLEAAYLTAEVSARAWNADASLSFASLQADWPLDPQQPGPAEMPPGGWVRFAFVDGAQNHLLSIVIERYSGEIVTAESQPWDGTRTGVLLMDRTGVTSETAVVIAESGYGQAYRLQCPVQRHETDVTLLPGALEALPGFGSAGGTSAATPATPHVVKGTPIARTGTPVAIVPTSVAVTLAETPTGAVALTTPRWLVTYRDGAQPGVNSVEMEIDATTGQILFINDRSKGCSDLAG